jgi:hypothetical protein
MICALLVLLTTATAHADIIEGRELPRPKPSNRIETSGVDGTVLVAFSIDGEGHVVNPVILSSAIVKKLDVAALHEIAMMRFDVPTTWAVDHPLWQRYWLAIDFKNGNCSTRFNPTEAWGFKISTIAICRH